MAGFPPLKNAEYIFYTYLLSQADPSVFQANPTLAAGDVKVSTDGGAFGNITTLPTVTPASGKAVKVTLSAAEMNGSNVVVVFSDAAGAEWTDQFHHFMPTLRQIDDLSTQASVDVIDGNVDAILVDTGTSGVAVATGAISTTQFAAGAIDAAALAADAGTEIGSAVWASATRTLTEVFRIKKNTALSNFMFLMVDSTDNVTPKTGLTVTAQRSIDGAAFAGCANPVSEIASGFYKIDLATTDLNGDVIALKFTGTGAAQRSITVVTQPNA